MTSKSAVQSWSRSQLESAFTQREAQLAQVNEWLHNFFMERGCLKNADAERCAKEIVKHFTTEGWLSPDEAKRLEAQCAAMREALQELTDAIYGDYRRMKLYASKASSLTDQEQRIVTAYDNARQALKSDQP